MADVKNDNNADDTRTEEDRIKLQQDAIEAVSILKRVTTALDKQGTSQKTPKTPKGIAIMVRTKAGLGLGLQFGSGFVVARLRPGKWSAPSFYSIRNISAGLTLGYAKVGSVIFIKDDAALETFMDLEINLGTDIMLHGRADPHAPEASVMSCTFEISTRGTNNEPQVAAFTLADGMGIDFSLKGGVMRVDGSKNHALYGEDATPARILKGEVSPPREFQPLYDALNAMTRRREA